MISYEKLLEKVLRAAEMLPDEDRRAFHYFSNTNEIHGDAFMTSQALAEIANDLRAAIAEQTEKGAGRGSAQKAMLRILKRAHRENMRCAWLQEGKQYVCNGTVAVELAEPISGLPAPEFDRVPFDVANVIDLASPNNGAVLPVPSLSALKTHIKGLPRRAEGSGQEEQLCPAGPRRGVSSDEREPAGRHSRNHPRCEVYGVQPQHAACRRLFRRCFRAWLRDARPQKTVVRCLICSQKRAFRSGISVAMLRKTDFPAGDFSSFARSTRRFARCLCNYFQARTMLRKTKMPCLAFCRYTQRNENASVRFLPLYS